MIGGGVAVLDCDGNGLPDLFIAGGANPAALYRNESRPGGSLAFAPVADPATSERDVMGAYPIDIDGDGHVDLVVLRVGGVDLLRGLGDCRFERANEAWSFAAPATWTTAFSATWEGAAKLPTLAFGNYVGLDASGNATYTCPDNELFRPDAVGLGLRSRRPRSRPATAPCRCCSATGTAPGVAISGSPTTGTTTTTRSARTSCGGSPPVRRRASTPPTTDGCRCRSGAWGSRATT